MVRDQPTHVTATFYAQVDPRFGWGTDPAGNQIIESAAVRTVTQSKPRKPQSGCIVVKLSIKVPTAAFLPLSPEAIVVIPADLTEHAPVEVEALDPTAEELV